MDRTLNILDLGHTGFRRALGADPETPRGCRVLLSAAKWTHTFTRLYPAHLLVDKLSMLKEDEQPLYFITWELQR